MLRATYMHIAGSALAIGLVTAGCSTFAHGSAASSAQSNGNIVVRADSKAIISAENAVEKSPGDANLRTALGQKYMAAGRFASAETSFAEAFAVEKTGRTALNLAIAQIANGKLDEGKALVDEYREQIPASDYGLALALSGETQRAVMVLNDAVRLPDATARARQNLAFAYAMSGRWLEAKVIAAQDMPLKDLETRMTDWAASMQNNSPRDVVAGLMRVHPDMTDAGMPTRLARNVTPNAPVLAAAPAPVDDPAPLAQFAPPPLTDTAVNQAGAQTPVAIPPSIDTARNEGVEIAAAAPTLSDEMDHASVAPVSAPVVHAKPYKVSVKLAPAKPASKARVKLAPIGKAATAADSAKLVAHARKSSGYAVQLGAYWTVASAKSAWKHLQARKPSLKGYTPSYSFARVNGKNYVRLAANGVANKQIAATICRSVTGSARICALRDMAAASRIQVAKAPSLKTKVAFKSTAKPAVKTIASR